MDKKIRQYLGIAAALVSYYVVHEGSHLLVALALGVFKQIRFLGLGVQIDVESTQMSDAQMFLFCLLGAVSTLLVGYLLTALRKKICEVPGKVFRAVMYYITIAMLLLDPLYLSILCGFFGGGDMNGIALLVPGWGARIAFGALFLVNCLVFAKLVLPTYKASFENK